MKLDTDQTNHMVPKADNAGCTELDESHPPCVSIIALSYNHAKYVIETLKSIRDQTWTDFELIYADDASSDGCAQIASHWLDSEKIICRTLINSQNLGQCATLNRALSMVRGRYVKIIGCDDQLRPDYLSRMVEALETAPPDVALVYSNFSEIDENGLLTTAQYYDQGYRPAHDLFVAILIGHEGYGIAMQTATVLIRVSALREVGGYREDLLQEDFYIWLAVCQRYQGRYVPEILINYRVLETSLTRHPEKQIQRNIDYLKVLDLFNELTQTRDLAIKARREVVLFTLVRLCLESNDSRSIPFIVELLTRDRQLTQKGAYDRIVYQIYWRHPHIHRELKQKVGDLYHPGWLGFFRWGIRGVMGRCRRTFSRISTISR